MRAWKIHLCWGLVAIGTAGAWGRVTAARRETAADHRLAPAARAPEAPPEARSGPPPTPSAPRPGRPRSTLRLLPDPYDRPVEEIRARLKGRNGDDACQAVEAILHLKDPALRRELLLEALRSALWPVRERALSRLVPVLGDDAVPVLQGVLRGDPARSVRTLSAVLLGGLPDQGSTELLLEVYRTGEERLKVAAASSLYRFGNPGPAAELLPALAAGLDRPDGEERKDAVSRIGKLRAPIAIPVLTRALRDPSGEVRAEAVIALGEIDAPEIPGLLEPFLKDPFIDVRYYAKEAIEVHRGRPPK